MLIARKNPLGQVPLAYNEDANKKTLAKARVFEF